MTFWSRGLARSHDKLKIHFHYLRACGYQTWQGSNLRSWPINSSGTLITWSYKITWQTRYYISTVTVPMAAKLGRMLTYLHWRQPIQSHDNLINLSNKTTRHSRTIISPLPQCLWLPNMGGWWLTLVGFFP